MQNIKRTERVLKRHQAKQRIFDVLLSFIGMVFAALPMLCIALAIGWFDGAFPFFCQIRIGRGRRPFRMYKFRTMKSSVENHHLLTIGSDLRITRLGRWLRKYHLDELPQLLNIFIGDMSVIGPRPEIPEFVESDNPTQQQVLLVRPGLFDSAALHWLDEASILSRKDDWETYYRTIILPDKLERSLEYIHCRSIKTDLKLLRKALKLILWQPSARPKR